MKGYVVKVDNRPSIGIRESYLYPHILLSKEDATDVMQVYARKLIINASFKPYSPVEQCKDFIELVDGDENTVFISVEELTTLEPYKGD